jgi:hypothetical protein
LRKVGINGRGLGDSESDFSCLVEIEAEQRKLRGLCHDLNPRNALQIETVCAGRAPLVWRFHVAV